MLYTNRMIFAVKPVLQNIPNHSEPMFPDYQNMSTDGLLELLARETEKLTVLLAGKKFDAEYAKCKDGIKQLQVIIDMRKGITATPHPIFEKVNIDPVPPTQNDKEKTG